MTMTENRTQRKELVTWLTIAGLTLLCINPGYTQGEHNKNLLLATAMAISPLVLLIKETRVFIPRIDIPLGIVCLYVTAAPLLFHPESVRWITMLFTCACCVYFMMLARLVRTAHLSPGVICGFIRTVIYAFAAVLIIQQICLVSGLPVFCAGAVYPQAPWKLNSLTAEPSHTTITLGALMYFYTQTRRIADPETGLWKEITSFWPAWACWIWVLFSTVNASAFLLAPLAFLPYITRRNIWLWVCAASLAAAVLFLSPAGHTGAPDRLRKTLMATVTLDDKAIEEADASAAARIVPTIWGAREIHLGESDTWTGHGVDADQHDIKERPCDGQNRGFAGVLSMFYNYGAPCAIAFWWAIGSVTLIRRRWLSILTFLFAIQMSAEHNMQLVWVILAFSMVFKYDICGAKSMLSTWPHKADDKKSTQTRIS